MKNKTKKSLYQHLALIIILLFAQAYYGQEKRKSLSSLDISPIEQQFMMPQTNRSMTGERMNIAGQRFNNGISVHAPSRGYVYLGGTASRFQAMVGVDSDKNRKINASSVQSMTHTDGTKLFYYVTEPGQPRRLIGIGGNL